MVIVYYVFMAHVKVKTWRHDKGWVEETGSTLLQGAHFMWEGVILLEHKYTYIYLYSNTHTYT